MDPPAVDAQGPERDVPPARSPREHPPTANSACPDGPLSGAKESEPGSEERRIANFVDLIGEERGSQALANALVETERRVEALRAELEALSRSRRKVFQTPPVE